MPINIDPVLTSQPKTMKDAIDKIARNGLSLQNPSQGGELFTTTVPTVENLHEGAFQFVQTGGNMYIYTKIDGTRYRFQLTAA